MCEHEQERAQDVAVHDPEMHRLPSLRDRSIIRARDPADGRARAASPAASQRPDAYHGQARIPRSICSTEVPWCSAACSPVPRRPPTRSAPAAAPGATTPTAAPAATTLAAHRMPRRRSTPTPRPSGASPRSSTRCPWSSAGSSAASRTSWAGPHTPTFDSARRGRVHGADRGEIGGLAEAQAVLVVQIARSQTELQGATEDYLVTREFAASAAREDRERLLRLAFSLGASDHSISAEESAEINEIGKELGFTPDRGRHRAHGVHGPAVRHPGDAPAAAPG